MKTNKISRYNSLRECPYRADELRPQQEHDLAIPELLGSLFSGFIAMLLVSGIVALLVYALLPYLPQAVK